MKYKIELILSDFLESNGFTANFPPGQSIINQFSNKTCTVSIVIEFVCDKTAEWDYEGTQPSRGPTPLSFKSISEDSCLVCSPFLYF